MPKDRDQLSPEDPEDAEYLATHRGQGTGGTGYDVLPGGPQVEGAEEGVPDPSEGTG
jgi:hypothetical protein